MTKKDKIRIGVAASLLALNVAFMVLAREWFTLIWVIGVAFSYWCTEYFRKECMDRDKQIRFLTENNTTRRLRQSMREARISAENCYRYINTIKLLKEENERLKILNKNLIENKNTGVKNYARKRK